MIVEKSSLKIWLSTSAAPRLILTFLGIIFSTITLSRMLYLYNIILSILQTSRRICKFYHRQFGSWLVHIKMLSSSKLGCIRNNVNGILIYQLKRHLGSSLFQISIYFGVLVTLNKTAWLSLWYSQVTIGFCRAAKIQLLLWKKTNESITVMLAIFTRIYKYLLVY